MIKQFGTEKELWAFTSKLNSEFGGFHDVPWINDCGKSYSSLCHRTFGRDLPLDWEDRASQLMEVWVKLYRNNPDVSIQNAVNFITGKNVHKNATSYRENAVDQFVTVFHYIPEAAR